MFQFDAAAVGHASPHSAVAGRDFIKKNNHLVIPSCSQSCMHACMETVSHAAAIISSASLACLLEILDSFWICKILFLALLVEGRIGYIQQQRNLLKKKKKGIEEEERERERHNNTTDHRASQPVFFVQTTKRVQYCCLIAHYYIVFVDVSSSYYYY